jgi:hypothetical protein
VSDKNIRPFHEKDKTKLVEFFKKIFNGWSQIDINSTPREYWKWKYLDNPVIKNTVSVIEDKKKIVACHHHIYTKVKLFGRVVSRNTIT